MRLDISFQVSCAVCFAAIGALGATSDLLHGAAITEGQARVAKATFGRMPDGTPIDIYTLTNAKGLETQVMTYGATLITVRVPDREGRLDSVALYLDSLDNYLGGHPLFGSIVGRYANRIAGARFTLDGVEHRLVANAGKNHIHGGAAEGFQKQVWNAAPLEEAEAAAVKLSLISPNGQAGYPGRLEVTVTYRLTNKNELVLDYTARTDKPTLVNLTNHVYWNLAGAGSGDTLSHVLFLNADHYLPAGKDKVPFGEIRAVRGTVMDFTRPVTIGSRIQDVEDQNYDHCYVLNKEQGRRLCLAARVVEPKSGRRMEVWTTQPGVQLYTAKGLSSRLQAAGKPYGPYHGVCLETQHYPDSPNRPEFPSTVLRPAEVYRETTVYKFTIE